MKPLLLVAACCILFVITAWAGDNSGTSFKYIDSFAINTPPALTNDTASIAAYLLKGCKNDMEKARAAFTWVANNIRYDDNGFNSGKIPNQAPALVLKRRHAVCEGYANLYKSLCVAMGLEAVRVEGHAKAYGYRSGERFQNKQPNHAWNAVKVDGQWILVDVTWGAGGAEGERGKLVSRKQFTPYWFNVDKYDFLFQHYPVEWQWALLNETVTLRQYEEMPKVPEALFIMGFKGSDLYAKFLSNTLPKQLPLAFVTTHQLQLVDFPLDGTLAPAGQVDFTITSDENLVIAISNDLKQPPVIMTKSGNRYTASLPLKRGDLHIAVGENARKFSDILLYKVK